MRFIIKLLLTAVAVLLTSYVLPGVNTEGGFGTAILVAGLLAILNVTLKPLIILFTIPITFMTLGLFLFVINALIILLADSIIDGFSVDGFWWALLFSLILSFFGSVFDKEIDKDKRNRNR